jgi:hypothetical protein
MSPTYADTTPKAHARTNHEHKHKHPRREGREGKGRGGEGRGGETLTHAHMHTRACTPADMRAHTRTSAHPFTNYYTVRRCYVVFTLSQPARPSTVRRRGNLSEHRAGRICAATTMPQWDMPPWDTTQPVRARASEFDNWTADALEDGGAGVVACPLVVLVVAAVAERERRRVVAAADRHSAAADLEGSVRQRECAPRRSPKGVRAKAIVKA